MREVGKRKHAPGDRVGLDALVLKFGGGAEKGYFATLAKRRRTAIGTDGRANARSDV